MAVKTAKKTVKKLAKKAAKKTFPKRKRLTKWTLANAMEEMYDAYDALDVGAFEYKKGEIIGVLTVIRRLAEAMYKEGYSVDYIIDHVGKDLLADLAMVQIIDPFVNLY
jgi:hypothetical protein